MSYASPNILQKELALRTINFSPPYNEVKNSLPTHTFLTLFLSNEVILKGEKKKVIHVHGNEHKES